VSSRWTLAVLVGLIGLAIGITIGVLVSGSGDDNGSSTPAPAAGVSKEAIALPATLPGFRDMVDAISAKAPSSSAVSSQRAHQDKVRSTTESAYSDAYGGAAAAYRAYSNPGLDKLASAIAVRAEAPGLTLGPVSDPAYLKLATPDHEVKKVGDVECEIDWAPPAVEGQTPNPANEHIARCQRVASGVSVFVSGSGFTGPSDLQTMAELTDAAWSAASKS
jgi:hypothetical protein